MSIDLIEINVANAKKMSWKEERYSVIPKWGRAPARYYWPRRYFILASSVECMKFMISCQFKVWC